MIKKVLDRMNNPQIRMNYYKKMIKINLRNK